jgi:hypothetical protein
MSIDVVEREEIERVVGEKLVRECTDVYAEVRALQEILNDYSADTDALVRKCSSMPRSLGDERVHLAMCCISRLVKFGQSRGVSICREHGQEKLINASKN